ncbi:MAG: non-canonical purine NTP pyrophosphatase [Minisyncoccia bacterium]
MTELVYATKNPGKLAEVRTFFGKHHLKIVSATDLGILIEDPEESSATLEDNGRTKVRAYAKALRAAGIRAIVLSDDTGLEIASLGDEPGIHVRRWKDGKTRMSDEEIISYALERMQGLAGKARAATFRCVLAVAAPKDNGDIGGIITFESRRRGHIREAAIKERVEGFPFVSLFTPEKEEGLSHREAAIEEALPFLLYELSRPTKPA